MRSHARFVADSAHRSLRSRNGSSNVGNFWTPCNASLSKKDRRSRLLPPSARATRVGVATSAMKHYPKWTVLAQLPFCRAPWSLRRRWRCITARARAEARAACARMVARVRGSDTLWKAMRRGSRTGGTFGATTATASTTSRGSRSARRRRRACGLSQASRSPRSPSASRYLMI